MLLGSAYVRLGQLNRGLDVLTAARQSASGVHPTIRTELSLNIAIARYAAHDYDAAEAALADVRSTADIMYVRALDLRGWIAAARGHVDSALSWFQKACSEFDGCLYRDRFAQASVLYGLASTCVELVESDVWRTVEQRVMNFDWSADGLSRMRFWVSIYCSMMREVLGDVAGALAWARNAESGTSDAGYRVTALCRTAAILRGQHETNAHLEFTIRALQAYEEIEVRHHTPDQKPLPLSLAEEFAFAGATDAAARLLIQYREVIAPTLQCGHSDARYRATETEIAGSVALGRGDRNIAVREYASALKQYRGMGSRRRATAVALRLARLTGAARYVDYASGVLKNADPCYWMVRELRAMSDETAPALTQNQHAILTMVARGKTYKEIGSELGRSWKTVNNNVEQLRAKFGAGTRGELVAEAMRRGIIGAFDREGGSRSA